MKKIVAVLFLALFVEASEYVIVSNKNMKNLSQTEVKAIFLKKISFIDDTKVVPISLSPRDPVRAIFESKVLKMSFVRLKSYWAKQHYLGRRPPISMKSQESVKAFIKKVDGAIGYIDIKEFDDSLKIIYKWSD